MEDLSDKGGPAVTAQTEAFVDMLGKFYDYCWFKIDEFNTVQKDYNKNKESNSDEYGKYISEINEQKDNLAKLTEQTALNENEMTQLR